ncbi:MAG: hypothetical protein COV66_08930 [Nitrospinae bacterium CG11_big_fil_rev_8_21_14_0_20_45_15]|nr:MAG: hypothetical protein COV66_08930 [Nitrospinae bacterium CG11_big_fil_rev_8_21_14_0_20_45_15]
MGSENKQRLYLVSLMALVALGVGALSICTIYKISYEQKQNDLLYIVKSSARFLESVARFDLEQSTDYPEGPINATLSQFREAHKRFGDFGKTGEYVLARLEGDRIVCLLERRHSSDTSHLPGTTSLNSAESEEPMKRALAGQSGVMVARDYRGHEVLAAYEPVAVHNLGLVAKIDVSEIREPFITSALSAGAGGLVIIVFGVLAFFRLSDPLIASIRELQERYELAVRGSKDGLWDWSDMGKDEVWWSDDLYGLLGYEVDEIEAGLSTFKKLLHPEELPVVAERLKGPFEDGAVFEMEYRLKIKNGDYRWFHARGVVKQGDQGKPDRMSGSISDIHDQKMDRAEIEKLSQIIEQSPISVLITDREGNIEYANEALLEHTGYTREELLGKNPRIFKSGRFEASYYDRMWKHLAEGKTWRGVFHNKKKNGELYWESVLISPLKDSYGNVTNFIGLKEDITDKKRMESTLIDHERLIRSVVDSMRDGLIILNANGNIQLFNKGAEEILGYSAEEIMDESVQILMGEEDKGKHLAGFERYLASNKLQNKHSFEVLALKKDRDFVPVELTVSQMEQRGERLIVGVLRDISERKESEEKIEMAQNQVMQSQKLAAIGELAAGVSHEVLNPVNIISVSTQMLQRKALDDPKIQEYCDKVKHEIQRITKIMSALLAFSRESDSSFEKTVLSDEIDKVLLLVEEDLKLNNIKIVKNYSDTSVNVLSDKDKIRQVFLNLIANANHAMPKGGTLTISCARENKKKADNFVVKVSDTGIGMSEEIRSKIFDPFFTTKPEGEGTGMGLSIVHGIIEEHKGKIRVESTPGEGTTFIMTFPICDCDSEN